MKKFITDNSFWEIFPEARIGVLALKNVEEDKTLSEEERKTLDELLEKANEECKKYIQNEVISENKVPAVWREAYTKFPSKKGARSSIENLLKRVLLGKPVKPILPSVDITNAISLTHAFPIGAEDTDKLVGDIRLGTMKGGEAFLPIGSEEQDPPLEGEVAYYDEQGAVCRCWNWRDGQRTEISDSTRNEFIAMECVEEERYEELEKALDELAELMTKYLGAEIVSKKIITKDDRETVIAE